MRAHVFPVYFFAATFVHVRYTRTPTSPSSRGIRPSSCRRFKRFLMRPFRAGANKRFTTVDLTIRYRVCHISLQSPLPIFPVLCDCPPIHTSFARRTMRGHPVCPIDRIDRIGQCWIRWIIHRSLTTCFAIIHPSNRFCVFLLECKTFLSPRPVVDNVGRETWHGYTDITTLRTDNDIKL